MDQQDLRDCKPCVVEKIVGDGNCYFRALSFILIGSQENHFNLHTIIVNNRLGRLKNSCDAFLRTKYVYQQSNYRSVKDWVNKTGMDKNGKWATDLEVFATALLFETDIWVYLGPEGTR